MRHLLQLLLLLPLVAGQSVDQAAFLTRLNNFRASFTQPPPASALSAPTSTDSAVEADMEAVATALCLGTTPVLQTAALYQSLGWGFDQDLLGYMDTVESGYVASYNYCSNDCGGTCNPEALYMRGLMSDDLASSGLALAKATCNDGSSWWALGYRTRPRGVQDRPYDAACNGTCTAPAVCPATGDCEGCTCPGFIPDAPQPQCNGRGTCAAGVCSCFATWSGLACEIPDCPDGTGTTDCCGNGVCDDDGVTASCLCAPDWTGDDCCTAVEEPSSSEEETPITDEWWFWPAVVGGGVLCLVLIMMVICTVIRKGDPPEGNSIIMVSEDGTQVVGGYE